MDTQSDPYLSAASQAIQNGESEKAKRILVRILDQDPHNVEAWFLLSAAEDDPRAVAICLHNTLALDPQHDGAVNMMVQLEQQTGLKPLQVMQVGASSAAVERSCPYCSNPFEVTEEVVACPKCQVSHHYECWMENGHACAATLCDGFSVREVHQKPLPLQPQESDPETIVIRKEDIPDTAMMTRKQQEQRFQRRLLLMSLLAEEGQLPPGQARGVPSVDELLDQIHRDRATDDRSTTPIPTPNAGATSLAPQAMPLPYQSSGVVIGTVSIWPERFWQESGPAEKPSQTCEKCGYDFKNRQARFCPTCGTER